MNRFLITAALILGIASAARADVVRMDTWQFSNETSLAFNIKTAQVTEATYAGGFRTTLNGQSFLTYCVDLLQGFSWGSTYSNFTNVSAGSSLVPWFTASKAYDLGRLYTGYYSQVNDYVNSAAFQLATWAIVTESGNYSVKGNGLVATPYFSGTTVQENQAINTAETWLHSLPGYSNYRISVEYSPTQQDLIVAAANPIPEPASYALVAMSLGMLAINRRRTANAR